MRDLVVRDDRELRRLEAAIASIKESSPLVRSGRVCLLAALEAEREELLRCLGHRRGRAARLAA